MNKLIIGMIIGLVIGGMIGYFSYGMINKPNPDFTRGTGFQIDEETKSEIASFFALNPTDSETKTYCQKNPMNCRYYCTEINQEHEICSQIKVMDRGFKE